MRAAGRWVLVVGAAGGIGHACVRRLADDGFRVLAAARPGTSGSAMDRDQHPGVRWMALDLSSDDSIARAIATVGEVVGAQGLYGLVNCAGRTMAGPLEACTRDDLARIFDVNVVGPVALIKAALPMLRRARGRIVNVGSTSGQIPGAFSGPYCGTKFAMEALSAVLRAELAASGVDVSLVVPGVIATPFWKKAGASQIDARRRLLADGVTGYEDALDRRQTLLDRLMGTGLPPEAVATRIAEALVATTPHPRYIVGFDAKWKLALWRVMPDGLRARILRRGM